MAAGEPTAAEGSRFIEEQVPVISLPPSASARCEDGRLIYLDTFGLKAALSHNLVPLVQGDVAFDVSRFVMSNLQRSWRMPMGGSRAGWGS